MLRRTSVNVSRPDVAAVFPHVPGADRSGFHTILSLPTIKPDLELRVQAVLQDQSRVPLGILHMRLSWYQGTTTSDMPLISVIVPSYNYAHFLTEAIESILSQTYPHYEIVVVDDGSTDNTAEVAGRYPGVRCVRQDHQGLPAARNTGIRKSSGDYLVFLDADDRLLPCALEVGLACLRSHPECAFVGGRCARISGDGQPLPTREELRLDGDPYSCLLSGCPVLVPAVMYRRATFQTFPGFDTSMAAAEDYKLYYHIARELPIHFHDVVVAEVRQHHANMTSDTSLMLRANLTALRTQRRYVQANPQYRQAYDAGLQFWRAHYGGRLAVSLPSQIRRGQWKRALSEAFLLLRHYPQGLATVLHDQFWLWKYAGAAPARIDEIRQGDAVDDLNPARRLKGDRPASQRSQTGCTPPVGKARFGDFRRVTPIGTNWGVDRGQPIDRYYIEHFLARHAAAIRGRVLEIGDSSYTRAFGGDRVVVSDVLHVADGNPMATIVGDLAHADHIPSDSFDCIILTQTLQLVYDTRAAIETLRRILKPDGVVLATVPGITHIVRDEWAACWYWRFTAVSARRLFEEMFPPSDVEVECHGNVLTSLAFLHGLAVEELDRAELDHCDADYELLITVKAVKASRTGVSMPVRRNDSLEPPRQQSPNRERATRRRPRLRPMRTLVTGWFSYEDGHATAGDLLACDLVCEWLKDAGCPYDVAFVPPLGVGVDWRAVDPERYTHVVFVCGPFGNGRNVMQLLDRFWECRVIGVNLSMLAPLDQWNPFDLLLARDSSAGARPDITFLSPSKRIPVVGVILVEPHEGALDQFANEAINELIESRELVIIQIDTRLDINGTGLRSAAEVESLIARMDVVITTRLHGLVLALKNGVPAVAIDPIPGGFKIERQARTIEWPVVIPITGLTKERLAEAFEFCLSAKARTAAGECCTRAMRTAEATKEAFVSFVREPGPESGGANSPARVLDTMTANSENPATSPPPVLPVNVPSSAEVVHPDDSGPKALILLYHRVTEAMTDPWSLCVTSIHFAEHIEALRRHARITDLNGLVEGLDNRALPERSVVITFDDGYADNLYGAKRVLDRYGAQATLFIATGDTEHSEFWWDTLERVFLWPGELPESLHLSIGGCVGHWELGRAAYYDHAAFWLRRQWRAQDDPPTPRHRAYRDLWERLVPLRDGDRRRVLDELVAWAGVDPVGRSTYRRLSADEIRNVADSGLVDVGAHTVTHSSLTALTAASQWDEITESKMSLEEVLGRPVAWFAYPYGSVGTYTQESVALVRQAGFAGACTTSSGTVNLRTDRFRLPRLQVCDWDGDEFVRQVSAHVPGFF